MGASHCGPFPVAMASVDQGHAFWFSPMGASHRVHTTLSPSSPRPRLNPAYELVAEQSRINLAGCADDKARKLSRTGTYQGDMPNTDDRNYITYGFQ
ncbi:hypothetical protein GOP47_0029098 [Adiantum capillus-veneris]|nr:hypothetical protein GOP47_0029098 [Adiantum capillus-veneris]